MLDIRRDLWPIGRKLPARVPPVPREVPLHVPVLLDVHVGPGARYPDAPVHVPVGQHGVRAEHHAQPGDVFLHALGVAVPANTHR